MKKPTCTVTQSYHFYLLLYTVFSRLLSTVSWGFWCLEKLKANQSFLLCTCNRLKWLFETMCCYLCKVELVCNMGNLPGGSVVIWNTVLWGHSLQCLVFIRFCSSLRSAVSEECHLCCLPTVSMSDLNTGVWRRKWCAFQKTFCTLVLKLCQIRESFPIQKPELPVVTAPQPYSVRIYLPFFVAICFSGQICWTKWALVPFLIYFSRVSSKFLLAESLLPSLSGRTWNFWPSHRDWR